MSEKQVQGTNDSSIVSKASTVERGYFDDPFVSLMVRKKARRAPLINRGYYIRMKAMDQALRKFINATSNEGRGTRYIISLGAGFDTAYFRLKSKGLLDDVFYIEIDYCDVVMNKARLIQQSEVLSSVIGDFQLELGSNLVVRSADYCLVASDLTHEPVLAACLRQLIPDWEAPALFFSECVLTYVTPKHADRLIGWISQEFPCSAFLLYEQIRPHDSFGVIMCQHFKSLGSRLKCIDTYPYLANQRDRFAIGWHRTEALDMNAFYRSLAQAERHRVEHLEVFDEFEEWWSKCEHYFVLAAQTPAFCHRHRCEFFAAAEPAAADPVCWRVQLGISQQPVGNLTRIPARLLPGGCTDQFRLHWAALCPVELPKQQGRQFLLRIGGYGVDPLGPAGHRRLSCLTLIDPYRLASQQPVCQHAKPEEPCPAEWLEHLLGPVVFQVGASDLLLFGGKASPLRPSARLLRVHLAAAASPDAAAPRFIVTEVAQRRCDGPGLEPPCARWRHAGCSVPLSDNRRCLVLYGGRTSDQLCLADAYLAVWHSQQGDSDGLAWEALPACPGPRCSHAVCGHPSRPVAFLCGGLSLGDDGDRRSALRPMWDLWQLDAEARQWTQLSLSGRLSGPSGLPATRFGHSMHCLAAGTGQGDSASAAPAADWLICFGGAVASSADSTDSLSRSLTEPACLCLIRVAQSAAPAAPTEAAQFVNLAVDFSLDPAAAAAPAKPFLTFNAATALLTPEEDRPPMLVVLGGGGGCFSFGTHLNPPAVCLHLTDMFLPVAGLF